jgi:hypothetical protein
VQLRRAQTILAGVPARAILTIPLSAEGKARRHGMRAFSGNQDGKATDSLCASKRLLDFCNTILELGVDMECLLILWLDTPQLPEVHCRHL